MDKKLIFESKDRESIVVMCDCQYPAHQFRLWYDSEDKLYYLTISLGSTKNFFRRLWAGLKYILGYKSKYGEWDEIILNTATGRGLAEFLLSKQGMVAVKPIRTDEDHKEALKRTESVFMAVDGPDADMLEVLSSLIERYEKEHFPIGLPDPIDAILFRMDQQGLTPTDMVKYLGSQSKVSEVLNRKRPLSLTMIRKLNSGLGIPLQVLVS